MRGKKARAIRRQEKEVRRCGKAYGDDPSDENERLLDLAQEELKRLRRKGEPIVRMVRPAGRRAPASAPKLEVEE